MADADHLTRKAHVADTDQNPIPRQRSGVDWKAFAQYVGVTVGGLALSLGAWTHGAIIGHGDRLTVIETKEQARSEQVKADAAATTETLKEIRADMKTLGEKLDSVRLEVARGVNSPKATP